MQNSGNKTVTDISEKTIYTLLDISRMIDSALLDLTQKQFWVKGQVSSGRGNPNGHWYGELVGIDDKGGICAKIKATIWKGRFMAIQKKLAEAGATEAMKGNKEICVLCSVNYHHQYGLSLNIADVDPSFGEAQIAKNRREIIETLFRLGLLRKNEGAKVPVPPQRIGLVTSKGSAAEQDFIKTLDVSPYAFKVFLAHSSVQGENTAPEVIAAMRRLIAKGVDLICIVRGGGSQTNLAWFDHMDIAMEIVECPVPVFVGIGHEIDRGVLDDVAHTSFKTPTAVAEYLVATMKGLNDYLETAKDRLNTSVRRILDVKIRAVEVSERGCQAGFRKLYELCSSQFREKGLTAGNAFSRKLHMIERDLEGKGATLKEKFRACLSAKEARVGEGEKKATLARFTQIVTAKARLLDEKLRLIESMGTEKVLKRGFSLTRDENGAVISSAGQVGVGQKITTEFKDGRVESVTTGIA
jgi:exodeoxyribonuclease VII large subunit